MTIYSVSDAYKTAIRARTRTDRVTGTLTLPNGTVLNLDAADLMSGSLTLDNQCVTGEELAFGCAYLGQAALKGYARVGAYGTKIHRRKPVAHIIHHAPAHDGVARVDAQYSHSAIPFLL
mgnify:CR=1 FL=1